MDTVVEINEAFANPSVVCAPDLAEGFIQLPANGCSHETFSVSSQRQEPRDIGVTEVSEAAEQACGAPGDRPEAWGETVGFSLAVLVVIGLGTLGGWAVMLVFNSLVQAQSLVVQNSFVFSR